MLGIFAALILPAAAIINALEAEIKSTLPDSSAFTLFQYIVTGKIPVMQLAMYYIVTVVILGSAAIFIRALFSELVGDGDLKEVRSERVGARIDDLERKLASSASRVVLDADQEEKLFSGLRDVALERLVAEIEDKYAEEVRGSFERRSIDYCFRRIIARLSSEKNAQSKRAVVNLFLGVAAAGSGIALLYQHVADLKVSADALASDAVNIGLRFGVVFLVEVLAFFFLRLYKAGLDEIKYFQNEITNVYLRRVGVYLSMVGSAKPSGETVKFFVETERNFRLAKDETTVSLRKSEIEAQYDKSISETLRSVVESALKK